MREEEPRLLSNSPDRTLQLATSSLPLTKPNGKSSTMKNKLNHEKKLVTFKIIVIHFHLIH